MKSLQYTINYSTKISETLG